MGWKGKSTDLVISGGGPKFGRTKQPPRSFLSQTRAEEEETRKRNVEPKSNPLLRDTDVRTSETLSLLLESTISMALTSALTSQLTNCHRLSDPRTPISSCKLSLSHSLSLPTSYIYLEFLHLNSVLSCLLCLFKELLIAIGGFCHTCSS